MCIADAVNSNDPVEFPGALHSSYDNDMEILIERGYASVDRSKYGTNKPAVTFANKHFRWNLVFVL